MAPDKIDPKTLRETLLRLAARLVYRSLHVGALSETRIDK